MSSNVASVLSYRSEQDIHAVARSFVPTLRAAQSEIDEAARTPAHIGGPLKEAGLYSMGAARPHGGTDVDLATWQKTVIEIARGDAGVAWGISLVTSSNWIVSNFFPRSVSDQVFSKPGTSIAGVLSPRGAQVRRVEGGIMVDKGMWFFNSGVYQADWDLLGIPLLNESGEVVGGGVALVPLSDVKLLNDWNTSGLRGSGSTNVTMENVFIPDERIIDLGACMEGRKERVFSSSALYRCAVMPLMSLTMTWPVIGAGMHMLDEFMDKLPKRDIKGTPYEKSGEAPVTHIQLGQATSKIDLAKMIVDQTCKEISEWAERGEDMPYIQRARICRDCTVAIDLVWEAVELLANASGGSFANRTNTLNRVWQDVKVASMHPFLSRMTHYENYGRTLAGVQPPLTFA